MPKEIYNGVDAHTPCNIYSFLYTHIWLMGVGQTMIYTHTHTIFESLHLI